MPAFTDIVCYPNLLPFETTEANVDPFMADLKAAGVTHVQINHLPDVMHPEALAQPENVYLWFANFGPPLDLFVSSRLNRGLYPEMYLERNRRTLLRFAACAKRHGLKPLLYLCEPRFVPERFFHKHPNLRGPRVDNPNCSTTPLYALCTDRPEVQTHYRELMAQMMRLVPELSMAVVFTSDSGSGFDYNPDTYAGPNGAGFNRHVPVEKRVLNWLTLLQEAGARVQPTFTVNLTSGFSPELRARILEHAPAGVLGAVYGLWDWEGGLEEFWACYQYRNNIRQLDRVEAFRKRKEDIRQRIDVAQQNGKSPICHVELPNYDYPRPLRYVPIPWEVATIMKTYYELGARRLALWGPINPKQLVPWDVNQAVFAAMNADIAADTDAVVSRLATDWVGAKHAAPLVDAWRLVDAAHRERFAYNLGFCKQQLPGPLVPDLTRLTVDEVAYYRTVGLDDLERIQGFGYFVPHQPDEADRDYVLHTMYEKHLFPRLEQALAILDCRLKTATNQARAVLQCQREYTWLAWLNHRSAYNWYEAGRFLVPGAGTSAGRGLTQIIDDELQVTHDLIALLDGRAANFLRLAASDFMTYEPAPAIVDHLRERLKVMTAHRNDPPRNLKAGLEKTLECQKNLTFDGE